MKFQPYLNATPPQVETSERYVDTDEVYTRYVSRVCLFVIGLMGEGLSADLELTKLRSSQALLDPISRTHARNIGRQEAQPTVAEYGGRRVWRSSPLPSLAFRLVTGRPFFRAFPFSHTSSLVLLLWFLALTRS